MAEELPAEIKTISCANIDVDMYDAVKAALVKVDERLVVNGIMICEDYGHTPALIGAVKAVEEFLKENRERYIHIYMHSGQMIFIKLSNKPDHKNNETQGLINKIISRMKLTKQK